MDDVGEPEDVADLARFLVGPESRWITGQSSTSTAATRCARARLLVVPRAAIGHDAMLAKATPLGS